MPDREVDFLLIGGGIASATCAARLREEGADGSILLVGREADPPYHRPPLSKGYLRGAEGRDAAFVHPERWWADHEVELLTRTSAMKLDPVERVAKLSTKEEVRFGGALLATGANVRRLRAEGADLEGIHYLRAFANSDAIRADVQDGARVVLIGGSFIGCEVAATLTAMGVRCTIVMQEQITLERPFGREIGRFFHELLADRGVEIHGGDELERFEGTDGRVGRVVTQGGLTLDCDAVVVGAGVMPDVMLARAAKLELGESGGVRCSAGLRTSAPGVYAAGDMAEWESVVHGRPLRVEHSEVAAEHGRTAALGLLGREAEHRAVPYFWSDLADWATIEYVGPGTGDTVVRGSPADGDFCCFYVDDGRVTAALSVGRPGDLEHARRFIAERRAPDPAALGDRDTDLAVL